MKFIQLYETFIENLEEGFFDIFSGPGIDLGEKVPLNLKWKPDVTTMKELAQTKNHPKVSPINLSKCKRYAIYEGTNGDVEVKLHIWEGIVDDYYVFITKKVENREMTSYVSRQNRKKEILFYKERLNSKQVNDIIKHIGARVQNSMFFHKNGSSWGYKD
jgi:hypothetical protein